ncbi:MAG: aminotransferase class III-fold pyridoxal phosphate-dependent enzyme, partial [Gemmatimonadaceae bacterium]|nr:aminotransferase class III-fold pyridoxal phosphate-dependent enzyme [Gemmatimonadaceae bacterium]
VVVRGEGVWLHDAEGRAYLDAYNNVPLVGHCHPRVVEALARQAALLNTHTRYLHEGVLEYAERLLSLLPAELDRVMFTCTGSEANELALRVARARTGHEGVIVTRHAYHGNTSALALLSPSYPNPEPRAGWVEAIPAPDSYRVAGERSGEEACASCLREVDEAIERLARRGIHVAALLLDTGLTSDGMVRAPPGFVAGAVERVRRAGGVFIADEVQVGLGRVGTHWWAFEAQGVVPDIVTMGKPLGNGHPLGAVVTTPEIAARFANGMEYFNTFGGNPVSCAIGREVLAVMEREGLRERARETGAYLTDRLRDLGGRHPAVGDVRGTGLFLGVELVEDRDTRAPAGRVAAYVANRMRDAGVLVSTDGPHHNVLKIKPPLCFDRRDADQLAATMDRVLGETAAQ